MGTKCAVALFVACAAFLGATAAQAEVEGGAEWRASTTPWDAIGTGPGGRAVEVEFLPDNCGGERNRSTSVKETRTGIEITLHDEIEVFPPGSRPRSCPAPHPLAFLVKLARPLAGRRIYGRARNLFPVYQRNGDPKRVPRLIGFAPGDAEHALFVVGLRRDKTRVRHGRTTGLSRVLRQAPSSGKIVSSGSVVRFAVGR